ncbi:hypothetical protein [Nucisporomicrobium flavum]|uniref:hypothetical protein n=1 Tax=Nucisporomicrobium flavum TaxID=2785915 RepID=UPI0018F3956B|nr:hypothetical protein [Nucisporomicrobium flavum]
MARSQDDSGDDDLIGRMGVMVLGVALAAGGAALMFLLMRLWPVLEQTQQRGAVPQRVSLLGSALTVTFTADSALLALVMIASALGSFVHAATSFATYVGNRRLHRSWIWWYLLRLFIGAALAISFYFAVRGGLLSAQVSSDSINPYGIAALAALVGLFSKQATDKLREIFETMFRTAEGYGDDERRDKAANPQPIIVGVEPNRVPVGSHHMNVVLQGQGFLPSSVTQVRVPGRPGEAVARTMTYVGPTEISIALDTGDLAQTGALEVMVMNPEPGGGPSNRVLLDVHDTPS